MNVWGDLWKDDFVARARMLDMGCAVCALELVEEDGVVERQGCRASFEYWAPARGIADSLLGGGACPNGAVSCGRRQSAVAERGARGVATERGRLSVLHVSGRETER